MWLASKERLNVHFNPASLLSFGDALAFVNTLLSQDVVILGPQGPELMSSPTRGPGSMARLAAPENAPKMSEQMAVNADLTSRIPQKYLIQNQSGLRVYYWADEVRHIVFCQCCCTLYNSQRSAVASDFAAADILWKLALGGKPYLSRCTVNALDDKPRF